MSRRLKDKGEIILRTCQPASIAHFCLGLAGKSKIQAINAPADVIQLIGTVIHTCSSFSVARERK